MNRSVFDNVFRIIEMPRAEETIIINQKQKNKKRQEKEDVRSNA